MTFNERLSYHYKREEVSKAIAGLLERKQRVLSLGGDHWITYPILLDVNSDVMSDLMVTAVPTLLIVDQTGNIVYRHEGFNAGDEEIIRDEINKLLADK